MPVCVQPPCARFPSCGPCACPCIICYNTTFVNNPSAPERTPKQIQAVVSGYTDGSCSCSDLNGTYFLDQSTVYGGVGNGACRWCYAFPVAKCSGRFTGLSLVIDTVGGVMTVEFFISFDTQLAPCAINFSKWGHATITTCNLSGVAIPEHSGAPYDPTDSGRCGGSGIVTVTAIF